MKYRESKVIRFIEPPLKGDKIKVYRNPNSKKGFYYGIANEIILVSSVEDNTTIVKEMLVIDLSERNFELNEVDYFFLDSRVIIKDTKLG